jgi:hypothetical protein
MASSARLDDNIQINKFNVTTWTGDYGINKDGFPKWMHIDGSYVTQMDETPTEYPSIIDKDDETHFDPMRINMSGPMYLKETSVNPAPFREFPARKYEYDNGVVTWDRPGRPRVQSVDNTNSILLILLIIILIVAFYKSTLLKFLKS